MVNTITVINGQRFHVHFVPVGTRDNGAHEYTVEARRGQTRATLGRVYGNAAGSWTALRIGAPAWTSFRPTRAAAVADMLARRTHLDDQREAYTGATR